MSSLLAKAIRARALALIVVVTQSLATFPARAEPISTTSTEDLYADGQRAYEARQYKRAGRLWTQALELQPESPETSTTRANTVNWILLVYTNAYRDDHDAEHLRAAIDVAGSYERQQRELYGGNWQLPPDIARRRDDVEARLLEHASPGGSSLAEGEMMDARHGDATIDAPPESMRARRRPRRSQDNDTVPRGDDKLFHMGLGLAIAGGAAMIPAIWGSAVTVYKARNMRAQIAQAAQAGNTQADLLVLHQQGWLATTEGGVALVASIASVALVGSGLALLVIERRRRIRGVARVADDPALSVVPGGVVVRF